MINRGGLGASPEPREHVDVATPWPIGPIGPFGRCLCWQVREAAPPPELLAFLGIEDLTEALSLKRPTTLAALSAQGLGPAEELEVLDQLLEQGVLEPARERRKATATSMVLALFFCAALACSLFSIHGSLFSIARSDDIESVTWTHARILSPLAALRIPEQPEVASAVTPQVASAASPLRQVKLPKQLKGDVPKRLSPKAEVEAETRLSKGKTVRRPKVRLPSAADVGGKLEQPAHAARASLASVVANVKKLEQPAHAAAALLASLVADANRKLEQSARAARASLASLVADGKKLEQPARAAAASLASRASLLADVGKLEQRARVAAASLASLVADVSKKLEQHARAVAASFAALVRVARTTLLRAWTQPTIRQARHLALVAATLLLASSLPFTLASAGAAFALKAPVVPLAPTAPLVARPALLRVAGKWAVPTAVAAAAKGLISSLQVAAVPIAAQGSAATATAQAVRTARILAAAVIGLVGGACW